MMANNTSSPGDIECKITTEIFIQDFTKLPHSARATLMFLAVLNGLTALPTFLINLLVMWAVLESPRLRSSTYNILVAILSFTDLLTGLVVQPVFISLDVCYVLNCSYLCELRMAYVVLSVLNSRWAIVTLAVICFERYVYIQKPLTYSNKITTTKIIVAVTVGWLVVALGVVLHRIEHDNSFATRKVIGYVVLVPTVITIVFCSIKVHTTVRRHRRAIVAEMSASQRLSYQSKIKEFKRINAIQIALIVFAVLYSPLVIIQILGTVKGQAWASSYEYLTTPSVVTCVYFKSLINPFIYSIRLSDIRNGVKRKLPGFNEPVLVISRERQSTGLPTVRRA